MRHKKLVDTIDLSSFAGQENVWWATSEDIVKTLKIYNQSIYYRNSKLNLMQS